MGGRNFKPQDLIAEGDISQVLFPFWLSFEVMQPKSNFISRMTESTHFYYLLSIDSEFQHTMNDLRHSYF